MRRRHAAPRWRRTRLTLILLGFVTIAGGAALQWRATSPVYEATPSPSDGTAMPRRETRATLDPARFTGKAAEAYQVAREIPDVLDQLPCYCACRSEYGHVSLLSCYVDGHGST